jgi:hypothetical protein
MELLVSTHRELQRASPAGQIVGRPQVPAVQPGIPWDAQSNEQLPQWWGSVATSRHEPLQFVSGKGQLAAQPDGVHA